MLRPGRLKKGDKVRLIAPAGAITPEKFDQRVGIVQSLGLEPTWSSYAKGRYGYFSAPDQQRLQDLIEAFEDPDIKAVFCLRGGYGSTRIIDNLPYSLIRRNPKVFLGFSDITALQMAMLKKTGLVSFHTNLATLSLDPAKYLFEKMVFDARPVEISFTTDFLPVPQIISSGKAQGIITGGNLSLLVSLIGTRFQPVFKNRIVFIEEISEPPYKVDRMLTHLLMATDLRKAAAIILGVFHKCEWDLYYKSKEQAFTLEEIFRDRFGNFNIPVIYGFPLGHIDRMSILPLGAMAIVDTESLKIKLLKAVVE
jgi:muramoyltetrapeptide carboxypeptidase